MLGEAYFKLDRFKDAEYWYREALRVKPDHIPAHLTYGKLLTRIVRLIFHFHCFVFFYRLLLSIIYKICNYVTFVHRIFQFG